MKRILEMMNQRAKLLRQAINRAEKEAGTFPEGHLRVSVDKGYTRYYCVTEPGDTSGEYIKKKELGRARKLAQKDYHEAFLENARKELAQLENCMKVLYYTNVDTAFEKMSESRRKLIAPYISTDDLYAGAWLEKPYKTNPFKPENKIHVTDRGEMVRSKSEALIANTLYSLGIPYRYEEEVRMLNGKTRYPDFTLLKISTREEIYLEHLGLSDFDGYRTDNLRKLDEYQASGIYLGKNLIVTYEIDGLPLNLKEIRKMLKTVLEL